MKTTTYAAGMAIEPGMLITGMPNEVYHSLTDWLSKSALDLFSRSPAHLMCAKPPAASRAMAIGTATHTAILEPASYAAEYIALPDGIDRRSAEYKDASKIYGADNVLTATEADHISGKQDALLMNDDWREIVSQLHEIELSVFAKCDQTGALIKCRFDLLTHSGHAVDLKKTQDIRTNQLERAVLNYRYHVQEAFYRHVWRCATGRELLSYQFAFIEDVPPHSNVLVTLCDETRRLAESTVREELAAYADGADPASTIARPSTIISLPEWYLNRTAVLEIE